MSTDGTDGTNDKNGNNDNPRLAAGLLRGCESILAMAYQQTRFQRRLTRLNVCRSWAAMVTIVPLATVASQQKGRSDPLHVLFPPSHFLTLPSIPPVSSRVRPFLPFPHMSFPFSHFLTCPFLSRQLLGCFAGVTLTIYPGATPKRLRGDWLPSYAHRKKI